jgi:hypothetical protein
MNRAKNPKVQAAFARVPEDTKPHLVTEEAVGYFVEENSDLPFAQKVIAWFRAKLKEWVKAAGLRDRPGLIRWINELTESDLIYMAQSSVRAAKNADTIAQNDGVMASVSRQYIDSIDQLESVSEDDAYLADELLDNGAKITPDGMVRVYHRTSKENAAAIKEKGVMTAKEDGVFFSTNETGQAEGYGDAVIALDIPLGSLRLDDSFGNEAHVAVPTKRAGQPLNVSQWIVSNDDTKASRTQPQPIWEKGKTEVAGHQGIEAAWPIDDFADNGFPLSMTVYATDRPSSYLILENIGDGEFAITEAVVDETG